MTLDIVPADVTHVRLAGGTGEGLLDLMGIIGKIQLKVVAFEPAGLKG